MAITTIDWPSGLPAKPVTLAGERVQWKMPENTTISDKPDAGPPLSRPRSSAFYRPVVVPLVVKTDDQADLFYHFYMVTLASGTQPFNWQGWARTGPEVFRFDLSADPPDPQSLGGGVHKIIMSLLQYPEGAV